VLDTPPTFDVVNEVFHATGLHMYLCELDPSHERLGVKNEKGHMDTSTGEAGGATSVVKASHKNQSTPDHKRVK
jgi:hypothetical protein